MDCDLKSLLEGGIRQIDSSLLTDSIVNGLVRLYDEISLFNPAYKLVASEGKELVIKHLLDCLAPVPLIKKIVSADLSFADLGSGSGLPGIVLALAFSENSFTLVERMGRRAGFLRNTVVLTGLNGRVSVLEKNLEEVDKCFDIVTFRAFRHIKDIAQDLERITKPGSVIFAYKSADDDIKKEIQNLEEITNAFSWSVEDYKVPFLDAKRSMLILKSR